MSDMKKSIYYAGFVAIVGLVLTYVFWGADVIPDALATAGPGFIAGFADDAIIVLVGIISLTKWRKQMLGGKEDLGKGLKGKIVVGVTILLMLAYVFWPADLIADGIPIVGYIDDAIAIIGLTLIGRRIRERIGK